MVRIVLLLFVLIPAVLSDNYFHNPRGSNNRQNEDRRARQNANRLFDSENNNRGGYNVGVEPMSYYVGSTLQLQWTVQHSCGDQNNDCDVIIQYMCEEGVRDGTETTRIPANAAGSQNEKYGRHEDFVSYRHCRFRQRNKGLYTADQQPKQDYAIYTRQDTGGTRHGYECPEERDYYPYWHPTAWRDVAVFTNDETRCEAYKTESQNVKTRYYCYIDEEYLTTSNRGTTSRRDIPLNQAECESATYRVNGETKNGVWKEVAAFGIPAPDCFASQPSRDNHNGNGVGGEFVNYNWTVPDHVHDSCVLRIRYNITTGEFDRDTTTAEHNIDEDGEGDGPDVWTRHGLEKNAAKDRGYRLEGDPTVDVFNNPKLKLQLAIDTAQYGRTFQDRTHKFAIKSRAGTGIADDERIHNINVRGKRGNIVQVFPAVEYDFVPTTVLAKQGDHVHFQWTGSDNNPGNNDGEGRRKTDRSNVVVMRDAAFGAQPEGIFGDIGRSYPKTVEAIFLGLPLDAKAELATHRGADNRQNDPVLNDASAYFNLEPLHSVSARGVFNYMCTRNNNFSNRSQKGKIIVE